MTLPIEIRERRQKALKKMMDSRSLTPEDYEADTEEDVRPYFAAAGTEDAKPLGQFALETSTEKQTYFYVFDTMNEAIQSGDAYVLDDICPERPVHIADLDTGDLWQAHAASVRYEKIR